MYRALVIEPVGPHDPSGRVMAALVAACPSFTAAWTVHRAEWSDADEPHAYIDVSRFALHLVDRLERGDIDEFPVVFAAIEALLRDDDPSVRYLVKVGLLEDLGNLASNTYGWTWAARFRAWFGPVTADAWDDLHRLWGTGGHHGIRPSGDSAL